MDSNLSLEEIAAFVETLPTTEEPKRDTGGRALMAMGGAMLWPGLGHLISGKPKWAIYWFCLWLAVLAGAVTLLLEPKYLMFVLVLLPFGAVVQIMQLFHAMQCGRNSQSPMLGDPVARMLVGVVLAGGAVAGYYGLLKYIQRDWVEICYSPTSSMSPAIIPGDFFLNYKQQPIQRWDIVGVITPEGSGLEFGRLCKRLVGMPGERVEITDQGLTINSAPAKLPAGLVQPVAVDMLNTPLLRPDPLGAANGCWGRPITLDSNEYFFLGDYTQISADSRFWPSVAGHQAGAVTKEQLCGKVVAIIWPMQRWRIFETPGEAGK